MIPLPAVTMDRFGLAPPKFKPGFFVDHRKGDVGELRLLLRKMAADYKSSSALDERAHAENNARRREILKRLIRCMTLGMDVSRLYTEVVMVSHTMDPVQKKMIYMFLSAYSKDNLDLTVLTINTLLKDVESVDPVIRCLALRNISSFDTTLSNHYAKNAVLKKFHDPSDAVKRSAIIGGLRIYRSQCAIAAKERSDDFDRDEQRADMVQHLMSSLKSLNLDVMFDSMCVYSEMVESEGDILLSKPSVVYLINRIKKMNEWQQCLTLKLLETYTPAGDELFDLLNLLDDLLNYTTTAVFLATAKCFLLWTAHDDMLQLEVMRRIQTPMIALITQSCNEITYNLLLNTLLLIVNAPRLEDAGQDPECPASDYKPPFADHYEVFFFRYDDPSYIKHVKLHILVAIACEANSLEILNDINEYVSDTNHDIAAKSVKAVGVIALKSPTHIELIISQISVILTLKIPYLTSAALYVIRALLRAYPAHTAKLLQLVEDSRDYIKEPSAMSDYVWILGEYGDAIEHAPYTLEDIIDHPEGLQVTKELLCACVKVFFKRPPETFPALHRLFGRPRESFAMKLQAAEKIVASGAQQDASSTLENSMVELGILRPSADWREMVNGLALFEECESQGTPLSRFFPYAYGDVEADIFTSPGSETPSVDGTSAAVSLQQEDGRECDGGSGREDAVGSSLHTRLGPLKLVPPSTLLSEEYQKSWFECDFACQSTSEAASSAVDLNVEPLEDILFDVHIATLASGKSQSATKMYQYAQNSDGHIYYIELVMEPSGGKWRIQVAAAHEGDQPLGFVLPVGGDRGVDEAVRAPRDAPHGLEAAGDDEALRAGQPGGGRLVDAEVVKENVNLPVNGRSRVVAERLADEEAVGVQDRGADADGGADEAGLDVRVGLVQPADVRGAVARDDLREAGLREVGVVLGGLQQPLADALHEALLDVLHDLLVRDVALQNLHALHGRHVLEVHCDDDGLQRAALLQPRADGLLLLERLGRVLVDEVLVVDEVADALGPAAGRGAEVDYVADARQVGAVVHLGARFAYVKLVHILEAVVRAAVLALGLAEKFRGVLLSCDWEEYPVGLEYL
ncbi:adapter-related protein, putative [Babesia caballi]|uniref:Adapter-related protein, putative n=1 Tax=Babesia caballi TaxID=5871 RepID=A0AAV4LRS2_BABCB|nr:adapter-related protein, putative [Babesia caballi]